MTTPERAVAAVPSRGSVALGIAVAQPMAETLLTPDLVGVVRPRPTRGWKP